MKDFIRRYLKQINGCLNKISPEQIIDVADLIYNAYQQEKHVFVCGNGGSSATASHFVCDLAKGVSTNSKKRLKAIGLNDCIPLMMAWSNDDSFDNVFCEQLKNFARPGDVLIAISASGNSPNILNAVDFANSIDLVTVGLIGFDGGALAQRANKKIVVPGNNMEQIEDIHLIITHMIKQMLIEMLKKEN